MITAKLRMMSARDRKASNYIASPLPARRAEIPESLSGSRIDLALARLFPDLSRSRLQSWIRDGRVAIDGMAVDLRRKAWSGEIVELSPQAEEALQDDAPEAIRLDIVFEDADLIVINKPAGLVVHPGNGNRSGTLLNALLNHAPALAGVPRAGIVHRLDKDTSGLLVVAKSIASQVNLVRQLQARSVHRQYLALVLGEVAADGCVEAPIGRHPTQRTRMAVHARGREARTWYAPRERLGRATLIECRLDTGRTHQIRVHMASVGWPLVGDKTYGRRKTGSPVLDSFPRQALHAWHLGLIHPGSGQPCAWECALPEDFAALLEALRGECVCRDS